MMEDSGCRLCCHCDVAGCMHMLEAHARPCVVEASNLYGSYYPQILQSAINPHWPNVLSMSCRLHRRMGCSSLCFCLLPHK